jgi:hypothetical protein
MLYVIRNGYQVVRLPQEEIIYLISSVSKIQELGCRFVFSDGHGYAIITRWFNNTDGFSELDWETIYSYQWHDTPDDTDRKRRKQAELLIVNEIPLTAIQKIVTYNQNALDFVNNILIRYPDIDYIRAEINRDYYY